MRSVIPLLVPVMVLAVLGTAAGTASAQTGAGPGTPTSPPPDPESPTVSAPVPDHVDVHFDTGSAEIRASERQTLARLAALYARFRPKTMIVAGHTDAPGDPLANLRLSLRRAEAVIQALVARNGLSRQGWQVLGKGEAEPPVPTDKSEGGNRVVVVTWK